MSAERGNYSVSENLQSRKADYAREKIEEFGKDKFLKLVEDTRFANVMEDWSPLESNDMPASIGWFDNADDLAVSELVGKVQDIIWGKNYREKDGWLGPKSLRRLEQWKSTQVRSRLAAQVEEGLQLGEDEQAIAEVLRDGSRTTVIGASIADGLRQHWGHDSFVGMRGKGPSTILKSVKSNELLWKNSELIVLTAGLGNSIPQTVEGAGRMAAGAVQFTRQMVDQIKSKNPNAMIVIPRRPPYEKGKLAAHKWGAQIAAMEKEVWPRIQAEFGDDPNVLLVDTHVALKDSGGKSFSDIYAGDKWHMAGKGNDRISNLIAKEVTERKKKLKAVADASTANPSVEG